MSLFKECIKCNQIKPLDEYIIEKRGVRNVCKECIYKQKKIATIHRKQWITEGKEIPNICECCGKHSTKIVCDHDHTTGEFRGWLCDPCNRSIGQLGDNLEGLSRAVAYLQKSQP
jgi:hypothetical protein